MRSRWGQLPPRSDAIPAQLNYDMASTPPAPVSPVLRCDAGLDAADTPVTKDGGTAVMPFAVAAAGSRVAHRRRRSARGKRRR